TFKKIIKIVAIIMVLGMLSVGGLFAYYAATAPDIDPDKLDVPLGSELLDHDGEVFASLYDENRKNVEYEDLSEVLFDAVTATKDVRFFEDRKSTRLNSSHVSISYAVFCLKK